MDKVKVFIVCITWGFLITAVASAGDLKNFLDQLGASYNYTPPSSYKAGNYQVYAGPSLRVSIPNKNISLLTYSPPRFKADCSGLDFSAGAIGYLAENFDQIISNFTTLGLYGFLLGMASTSPTIAEVMKWLQQVEEIVRALQMRPCEVGMMLGQVAGEQIKSVIKTGEMSVSTSSTAEKTISRVIEDIKNCVYRIADGNFNQALENRLTQLGFSSGVARVVAYNLFPVVHLNARMDPSSGQCDFNPIPPQPALLNAREILYGWQPGKQIRLPVGFGTNLSFQIVTETEFSGGLFSYYRDKLQALINNIRTGSVTIDDKRLLYSPVMAPYRNLIFVIASHPEYEPLLEPIARMFALSVLQVAIGDIISAQTVALDRLYSSAKIEGNSKEFPIDIDMLKKYGDEVKKAAEDFRKQYYIETQNLKNELQVQLMMIKQAVALEKQASRMAGDILGVSLSE